MPSFSVVVAGICLLSTPLLSLLHQSVALAIALALHAMGSRDLFTQVAVGAGFDPVYASVFNTTLGNIEVRGMAVAGPLGDILHQLVPGLFAPSDQVVAGAWVTTLVTDGASLLATTLTVIGAEVIFILLGVAMVLIGLRYGSAIKRPFFFALALLGVMLQARGIVGLLTLRFSSQDLEIMGLAHVFTKLFPMDAEAYQRLVQEPWFILVAYLVPLVLLFAIYGPLLILGLLRERPWRKGLALPAGVGLMLKGYVQLWSQRVGHPAMLVVAPLLGVLLFQGFFPDAVNYDYPVQAEGVATPEAITPPPIESGEAPTPAPDKKAPKVVGPSKVAIHGAANIYSYTVNGRPERIQGVGYNVIHADLAIEARVLRYDIDFSQMKAAGINTILGWDHKEFDELTLRKAEKYGLGVVMPYGLPAHGDYGNPAYESQVEREVKQWVQRFRYYPALRMWGIGNEVIHGMGAVIDPRRSRAFARFYMRLVDAVHALDPDHPVIYRDAEDVYLEPIKKAYLKDGVHRPWFVYGINFFTPRLEEVLRDWPKKGMDVSLVVSEFAPSGLSLDDRPQGYLRMWKWIAKQKNSVLGGFAYVWTTNGPEAIDRVMGLVDEENVPVDGSLGALRRAFLRRADSTAAPQVQE